MKKFFTMLAMTAMMTVFGGTAVFAADAEDHTDAKETYKVVEIQETETEETEEIEEVTAYATFNDINADEVFIKQSRRGTCTLASATMVMRRAAMLNGDENWADITEHAVGSAAWGGCGLGWSFSYAGISMVHDYVSSTSELITLLENHPEGIVAYDSWKPHAICLTDYDAETDTFYCSDPSEYCPYGRYDVSEAMISLSNVRAVWYVSSPSDLVIKPDVSEMIEAMIGVHPLDEVEAFTSGTNLMMK